MSIITSAGSIPALSSSGWKRVEKTVKKAQGDVSFDETFYNAVRDLEGSADIFNSESTETSHVVRSPASQWGGREITDGMDVKQLLKATLTGFLPAPPEGEDLEARIQREVTEFPDVLDRQFQDALYRAKDTGSDPAVTAGYEVDVRKSDPVDGGFMVELSVEMEMTVRQSESDIASEQDDFRAEQALG